MRIGILFAPLALLFAAPAMAQSADGEPFRIFFDWAKPESTRDAQSILGEAVEAWQRSPGSRVEVAAMSTVRAHLGIMSALRGGARK